MSVMEGYTTAGLSSQQLQYTTGAMPPVARTILNPSNGWQQGILACWQIFSNPHETFRDRHDYASRLLWIALPDDRQQHLRNTALGDMVIVTARWWLAEHRLHVLQQRMLARQYHNLHWTPVEMGLSLGPEPLLDHLTTDASQRARANVGYPTQEDIRAWHNADVILRLLIHLDHTNLTTTSMEHEQSEMATAPGQ